MRSSPDKADELDLDLPALDGEEDSVDRALEADASDIDDVDLGDPFDDATGEDRPHDEIAVGSESSRDGTSLEHEAEAGWLLDSESAGTLDVGAFDVAIEPEGRVLVDDEADAKGGLEDLVGGDEIYVADSGEEGPLADDEELREEDLPALDADEDGDVADDELYDRASLATGEELRWADRAWARAPVDEDASRDLRDADDSGILAVPGDDPGQGPRDGAWKALDETGRVMAACFVPGGSVVLAVRTADRARALLVRIPPDGEARIIAEVDPQAQAQGEDDGEACTVTFVRWDAARGCVHVGGSFGVEAYRPTAA